MMSDKFSSNRTDDTVRIKRSDDAGEMEFELVSTAILEKILDSNDAERRTRLEAAAASKEGVLAQNLSSGDFEIIGDDDLQAALAKADESTPSKSIADVVYEPVQRTEPTEELSLVSTQALRKLLGHEEPPTEGKPKKDMPGGGFDPYNSS